MPRKFRLPAKYNAVSFPDGWDKTPQFKRIVKAQLPSDRQLSAPIISMTSYMKSLQTRVHLHSVEKNEEIEPNCPPKPLLGKKQPLRFAQRYPLPTTFAPGQDIKSWQQSIKQSSAPLTQDPKFYPFKYYEVTMIRGLIGLPKTTKNVAHSLGLRVVNQVVYLSVSTANAGKLLKLKELIRLRLVNEIEEPVKTVLGFTKIGNTIGKNLKSLT